MPRGTLGALGAVTVIPRIVLAAAGAPSSATPPSTDTTSVLLNPFDLDASSLYMFELFLTFLVALYCLNFAFGVHRNLSLARSAADSLDRALLSQFTSVSSAGGAGKRLLRDGGSEFWYYATGRLRTSGLAAHLVLRPRQDLFSLAGSLSGARAEETLTLLAPVDAGMEPLSVLLLERRELARAKEAGGGRALKQAQRLAGEIADFRPIDGCVVMAETREGADAVLTQAVTQALRGVGEGLRSVHVSEFQALWDAQCEAAKKFVRMRVGLPEEAGERARVVEAAAKAMTTLVDTAAAAKLSVGARKKATEMRRTILAEEERERQRIRREEMADRREAKKKEKVEAVAKMSAEKQAKYDEKMRKKAFKARLKKVTTK